ncbi:MAG: hypothetical protein ACREWG_04060 [Gammaproteobacteria bacterium]
MLIIERLWDYSCDWRQHLPLMRAIRQQGAKIIYETDDDLLSLNSEGGAPLRPSEEKKMWLRQVVKYSDGVIVSTKTLASRLGRLNPNIEVVENALDERVYSRARARKPHNAQEGLVVFGYMGTYGHMNDMISIIQPLRSILARFRDRVRFEIIGIGDSATLTGAFHDLPVRYMNIPDEAVPYEKFVSWMIEEVRWDFGIAPLIDSNFTRSKSDIKYLDYGVQGIPGIFSDVPAYRSTIRHGENGILATDIPSWEQWLSRLIMDNQLRMRLATRAHEDVWKDRMLKTEAKNWLRALRKLMSYGSSEKSVSEFWLR